MLARPVVQPGCRAGCAGRRDDIRHLVIASGESRTYLTRPRRIAFGSDVMRCLPPIDLFGSTWGGRNYLDAILSTVVFNRVVGSHFARYQGR